MNKIAQIIPYFGKWPEWFELYLYSCNKNRMIDFIFYTDCPLPKKSYSNTHLIPISFTDYQKLVGQRLGIDYSIDNPYKLTDLKPFLGAIHKKELLNYEFWSFGDLDLIYGDLSGLLCDYNLGRYDIITTHNYHVAGHFTVIRNNNYWCNLCFKLPNWEQRLCGNKHFGFDEGEWSKLAFPRLLLNRLIWKYIVSKLKVTDFFTFLNTANKIIGGRRLFHEAYTSPNPKYGQEWLYNPIEGKVSDPTGRELPYIHFLFFKKTPWLETDSYWREDFYKLGHNSDFERMQTISVSLDGIKQSK